MKVLTTIKDLQTLRSPSKEISLPINKKDERLALRMLDYIKKSQDLEYANKKKIKAGIGLASPQLGILKRIIVIYLPLGDKTHSLILANPKIVSHSIKKVYLENGEGCLSVKEEHEGYVYRHEKINVKAYDIIKKKDVIIKADDYLSIAIQHEIDHLNGILYYDHINKKNPYEIKENSKAI